MIIKSTDIDVIVIGETLFNGLDVKNERIAFGRDKTIKGFQQMI